MSKNAYGVAIAPLSPILDFIIESFSEWHNWSLFILLVSTSS